MWGNFQAEKFAEIATLLNDNGTFIVSYVNFDHRDGRYTDLTVTYNLSTTFVRASGTTSRYAASFRPLITGIIGSLAGDSEGANMYININIPFIRQALAVEYFFICSSRYYRESR